MRFVVRLGCAALFVLAVIACKASSKSGANGDPSSSSSSSSSSGSNGGPGPGTSSGQPGSPDAAGPPPAVNLTLETMPWNGNDRYYMLGLPRTYDASKTYPLVMSFHGNPGTAEGQAKALGFESASDQDAVLVYPQALETQDGAFAWDLYTADNADMGWIKLLIDEVKKKANIDTSKVFGFGYSGGGFFIAQYACRFGGVFRAIASNAGGGPDDPNNVLGYDKRPDGCFICPGGPIPILVSHGEADGEVEVASGIFTADCYADANGCSGSRTASTPAPCEVYDGCSKPVKRCIIPGQNHYLWGGARTEAWTFFKAAP
jgi:polyhydroxybutyrate depolymerase